MSLSPYTYSPLASTRSVRFVQLLPGHDEAVTCEIFEVSIDAGVSFTALSYAWGSNLERKEVTCNGLYRLSVTANLFDALWQIRHPTNTRVFWIDAICIDQSNVSERNHQVTLMANIYGGADRLLVWLGKEDAFTTVAVKLIIALAAYTDEQSGSAMQTQTWVIPEEWQAFKQYLGRSWFRRMWVIQELVLGLKLSGPNATLVVCGSDIVDWIQLAHACDWVYDNYPAELTSPERAPLTNAVKQGVERVRFLHKMALEGISKRMQPQNWIAWLTSNVPIFRSRQASDPRDKIFALYGLCHVDSTIMPDYALSTGEVYHGFAYRSITQLQSLDLLHEVDQRGSLGRGVPSWVPDWKRPLDRNSFRERTDFAAFVGTNMFTRLQTDPQVLEIESIVADEILVTTDVLSATNVSAWGVSIWNTYAKHLETCLTGEPAFSCYIRTLVADSIDISIDITQSAELFWESIGLPMAEESAAVQLSKFILSKSSGEVSKHRSTLAEFIKTIRKLRPLRKTDPISLLHSIGPAIATGPRGLRRKANNHRMITVPGARSYRQLLLKWTQGRVFFTTKNGYMGLGVAGTKAGDVVAILYPGRTPFVLRSLLQNFKGRRAFTLVGESYVHGLMNGEVAGLGKASEAISLL